MTAPSKPRVRPDAVSSKSHQSLIMDQFSRQADLFARSPELHNEAALSLLVEAASPRAEDESLDVACGPGTVVAAFAGRVRRSVGLDATAAMLEKARELEAARSLQNVEWRLGDVYQLPFPDGSFDIASCRFAFHHFQDPRRAFAEMIRVCRPNGRIVLCDGLASDDPTKAAAFNQMERLRDPSTVEFRPLAFLLDLFAASGLPRPAASYFQVPVERERQIAKSFPAGDDRERLRRMIDESVEGDKMGVGARREHGTVKFVYPSVILVAVKHGG
jgi:ubiquinone/menaquinone biosynthesis C-methylase UbiE